MLRGVGARRRGFRPFRHLISDIGEKPPEWAEMGCRFEPKQGAGFVRNGVPASADFRCRFGPIYAIIAGSGKNLYITDDLGQNWTPKATSCGNVWYVESLGSRVSAQSAACSTQSILLWLSMDKGTSWQDVSKNPIIATLKGRVYTGVESKAFYIGSLENIPHNNPIRGPYMEYKNTRYRSPDGVQWVMDSPYPRPLVNVELGSRLYTTQGGYIYYQEKGPTTAINNSRLFPGSLKATTTEFTYLGSNGILRRFGFQTSQSGSMEILSIEATGRMRTLLNQKILGPGSHEFQFNIPVFTNQFILAKWNGQIYRLQTRK